MESNRYTTKYNVGDLVKIVGNISGHRFQIDDIVKVAKISEFFYIVDDCSRGTAIVEEDIVRVD